MPDENFDTETHNIDPGTPPMPIPVAAEILTKRQKEVALLLAVGATNREIADHLGCSIKTVDTHRGALLRKLQLQNNVELARYALRVGWVEL